MPRGKECVIILILQMKKLGLRKAVIQGHVALSPDSGLDDLAFLEAQSGPGGRWGRVLGLCLHVCTCGGSHRRRQAAALTAVFPGLLGLHGNPHATSLGLTLFLVLVKCFVECMPFVPSVGILGQQGRRSNVVCV